MKKKKTYDIFFKILFILILYIIFIIVIGKRYLSRLEKFIFENNELLMKNELNNFIIKFDKFDNNIYSLKYNKDGEITSANLDAQNVNNLMADFTNNFQNQLYNLKFSKYLDNYFRSYNTSSEKYFLVPLGIISDNPFIFNTGPLLYFYYDVINVPNFKVVMDIKNYGLNNVIINIYLKVNITQNITKPILTKNNDFNYKFLIMSQVVYGRVSNFLSTELDIMNK